MTESEKRREEKRREEKRRTARHGRRALQMREKRTEEKNWRPGD
jgi:hypothetical protein